MLPGSKFKPLGTFDKLPPEIRQMIYRYFEVGNGYRGGRAESRMGLLLTCKTMSQEASNIIYQKEIITYHLTGPTSVGDWNYQVYSRHGVLWTMDEPNEYNFDQLPLERLRRLRIRIDAHDEKDPGRIIQLWQNLKKLIDFLLTRALPLIIACFHDIVVGSKRHTWVKNGKPRKTIPHKSDPDRRSDRHEHLFDYDALMLQICRLPPNIVIISSPPMVIKLLKGEFAKKRRACWYRSGSGKRGKALWQELSDAVYFQYEEALDLLPGEMAGKLRLKRYALWHGGNNSGSKIFSERTISSENNNSSVGNVGSKGNNGSKKSNRSNRRPSYIEEWERVSKSNVTALTKRNSFEKLEQRYSTQRTLDPKFLPNGAFQFVRMHPDRYNPQRRTWFSVPKRRLEWVLIKEMNIPEQEEYSPANSEQWEEFYGNFIGAVRPNQIDHELPNWIRERYPPTKEWEEFKERYKRLQEELRFPLEDEAMEGIEYG